MPNLNSDSERVDIEMRNVLEDISIFSYLGRIKFFLNQKDIGIFLKLCFKVICSKYINLN